MDHAEPESSVHAGWLTDAVKQQAQQSIEQARWAPKVLGACTSRLGALDTDMDALRGLHAIEIVQAVLCGLLTACPRAAPFDVVAASCGGPTSTDTLVRDLLRALRAVLECRPAPPARAASSPVVAPASPVVSPASPAAAGSPASPVSPLGVERIVAAKDAALRLILTILTASGEDVQRNALADYFSVVDLAGGILDAAVDMHRTPPSQTSGAVAVVAAALVASHPRSAIAQRTSMRAAVAREDRRMSTSVLVCTSLKEANLLCRSRAGGRGWGIFSLFGGASSPPASSPNAIPDSQAAGVLLLRALGGTVAEGACAAPAVEALSFALAACDKAASSASSLALARAALDVAYVLPLSNVPAEDLFLYTRDQKSGVLSGAAAPAGKTVAGALLDITSQFLRRAHQTDELVGLRARALAVLRRVISASLAFSPPTSPNSPNSGARATAAPLAVPSSWASVWEGIMRAVKLAGKDDVRPSASLAAAEAAETLCTALVLADRIAGPDACDLLWYELARNSETVHRVSARLAAGIGGVDDGGNLKRTAALLDAFATHVASAAVDNAFTQLGALEPQGSTSHEFDQGEQAAALASLTADKALDAVRKARRSLSLDQAVSHISISAVTEAMPGKPKDSLEEGDRSVSAAVACVARHARTLLFGPSALPPL
eukprot:m51a1_g1308 hypothetical protein (663) ;mRNA; f:209737-211868